jgi:Ca-activated chloride channel family protein
MTFTWPAALAAFLLLPFIVGAYAWSERRRRASQAAFGNPDLLPNVVDRRPGRLRYLPLVVCLLALAAMIVGVARPHATVSVPREEATIMLAIDVSRSMKADDVEPTRLEAARRAATAFLAEVPEKYQVGVVTFATRAAVGVPPTADRALVEEALALLTPGEGTAIGDAVALSLHVSQPVVEEGEEPPPRAILLISDGKQDGGRVQPAEAISQARAQGVPVYTVLMGTAAGVVEETLPGGFRRVIQVPADPATLEQMSAGTGGAHFTAVDTEQLSRVYEELGSRLGSRKEKREITDVFAAGAALLLLVGGSFSAFLFRRPL